MTNLSFVVGRVSAQEAKLLVQSQLDRMIGAKNSEEAFKILLELQYSELIDEEVEVKDFYNIIRQGLFETKSMILDGVGDSEIFNFYWAQFDVNNIKKALKLKLIEGETEIKDFTEEAGFSSLGSLHQDDLETVIFKEHEVENLDKKIMKVVKASDEIFKAGSFLDVELALDKALAKYIKSLKKKTLDPFFHKLVDLWIQGVNIRNLSRSVLVRKTSVDSRNWIESEDNTFYSVKNIKSVEDLSSYLSTKGLSELAMKLDEKDIAKSMYAVEKALSQEHENFIKWEAVGGSSDVASLMGYFEKRMSNAQKLKLVMYCKFNDFKSEKIYELLEQL